MYQALKQKIRNTSSWNGKRGEERRIETAIQIANSVHPFHRRIADDIIYIACEMSTRIIMPAFCAETLWSRYAFHVTFCFHHSWFLVWTSGLFEPILGRVQNARVGRSGGVNPYPQAICILPSSARIKRPRWWPVELNDRRLQSQGKIADYEQSMLSLERLKSEVACELVELMTLLGSPIFDFRLVISALTAPTPLYSDSIAIRLVAHVSFGQRKDTQLWNNQFTDSKILGVPASRLVRALVRLLFYNMASRKVKAFSSPEPRSFWPSTGGASPDFMRFHITRDQGPVSRKPRKLFGPGKP